MQRPAQRGRRCGHPTRARPLRRQSGRHRRRVACPVDRHRRYDPQRPDLTPTFGARGDCRDGGPSSRHVRASTATPVSDRRHRPQQGDHDPARCDRAQRPSCEAPEQTHHLDVGHVAPWKGHREGHRRDAFAGRCGGSPSIPRRRSNGSQGRGRRRRGIPRGPNRTGAAQRRGGFGQIRPRLLRRSNVGRAHPAVLRRRAAVRLHGAGDLRRTRRSDSERQARRGDRISACCRAAQRRGGHRRRPRRPGRAGRGAAPNRHAAPPCRLHGGRGASTGTGDGVVGRGQGLSGACTSRPRRTAETGVTATMPPPNFGHLLGLTDRRGTFEHARHGEPSLDVGYRTDDVARALVVATREPSPDTTLNGLAAVSLRFLGDAQALSGACYTRMDSAGRWPGEPALDDCWGLCIWALGTTVLHSNVAWARQTAIVQFERAAQERSPWPRAMAYAALGAADVLAYDPEPPAARKLLSDYAATIAVPTGDAAWPWPEPRLTYANAVLAEAMIAAGVELHDATLRRRGLDLLAWLVDYETAGGHLSPTPIAGRGPDDARPGFDQQPAQVSALPNMSLRWTPCRQRFISDSPRTATATCSPSIDSARIVRSCARKGVGSQPNTWTTTRPRRTAKRGRTTSGCSPISATAALTRWWPGTWTGSTVSRASSRTSSTWPTRSTSHWPRWAARPT